MFEKTIEKFSYDFWVIKKVEQVKCRCLNPTTKEANPGCLLCLGLGTKIKIYKVRGTSRETREFEAVKSDNISVTPKVFYIKNKLYISKADLIIDRENIYSANAIQYHRGVDGKHEFTRVIAPMFKQNRKLILKNFKEKMRDAGKRWY